MLIWYEKIFKTLSLELKIISHVANAVLTMNEL